MFQFQLHNKIQMSSARECFIANAAAAAKCIVTAVHRRILSSALEHLKIMLHCGKKMVQHYNIQVVDLPDLFFWSLELKDGSL